MRFYDNVIFVMESSKLLHFPLPYILIAATDSEVNVIAFYFYALLISDDDN